MSGENGFNLARDKWIPTVNSGLVSLMDIFSNRPGLVMSGTPLQKIATLKLLLAIAQRAATPENDEEWKNMGAAGMSYKCSEYIEKWAHKFDLYGETPFLQFPGLKCDKTSEISSLVPEAANGNKTVLTGIQKTKTLTDHDKAMLMLTFNGFAFGGKKIDPNCVLSPGHTKKVTGSSGALLGMYGYAHHFLWGADIKETVWMNLLTAKDISEEAYLDGIGVPPWEEMPDGEIGENADKLSKSLMGTFLPFSRFYRLEGDTVHATEGIPHPNHKEGWKDMSIALNGNSKKVLWIDPNKRLWRNLTALFSFIIKSDQTFDCPILRLCCGRVRQAAGEICIWAGGLNVSFQSGEQYCSGLNDYLESTLKLKQIELEANWYDKLRHEMKLLESLSKNLYGAIGGYLNELNRKNKDYIGKAVNSYWEGCENYFEELLHACDDGRENVIRAAREKIAKFASDVYDANCPAKTAREMGAWYRHRLRADKYVKGEADKNAQK